MKQILPIIFLLILIVGLCAGCANPNAQNTKGDQHFDSFVIKAASTPVGRLYYIHGYYNTIDSFRQMQYPAQLEAQFHAKGWEIVYIDWPALNPAIGASTFSSDQGKAYVDSFKSFMTKLDASLAPVPKTVIGGFSFGGIHSVWAAEAIHADAVFAMQPVVIVSALTEFKGLDTTYADMASHVIPQNFWMAYGTLDDRVDGPMDATIPALQPYLHAYVTDHTANYNTGGAENADMEAWLNQTLIGGF